MENINAVREAIETLNHDEKINDGTYLELMNHLKSLYEKLDRTEVKQFADVRPSIVFHRTRVLETMDESIDRMAKYFRGNGWMRDWDGDSSRPFHTEETTFIRAVDAYLSNTDDALNDSVRQAVSESMNYTHSSRLHYYLFRNETKAQWISSEMREKWLRHPRVRDRLITISLADKEAIIRGVVIMSSNSDENYAKYFYQNSFPFCNEITAIKRRGDWDIEARTPTELKKLHRIRIVYKLNDSKQRVLELYTDKIQLGRSPIVAKMYRLALVLAIAFPNESSPIERYLLQLNPTITPFNLCPNLITSGITAKTRNKARTYTDDNKGFTIEYKSVNVVETGT